jgi:hypothetical protein
MSASLRTEYWKCTQIAERRAAHRQAGARLENAGTEAALDTPDPQGYFFRPGRGRSLRLQDGIQRHPSDSGEAQQREQQQQQQQEEEPGRDVKHHHVLWSAAEPWGAVPYQSAREAIHDVRATPGFRAGLGEKGYSRLQQKKPVELNEMRKFLAGLGLHRYTEKLQRCYGVVTVDHLLDIRRPQLESPSIAMSRPEILVFERAVKELARDYIKRNRSATVARRVWDGSGGGGGGDSSNSAAAAAPSPAESRGASQAQRRRSSGSAGAIGRGAVAVSGYAGHQPQHSQEGPAATLDVGAGQSFGEVMAEFDERHKFLQQMRGVGKSGVHEGAMKREMTQRLRQMEEIDQAKSMATLWKEARSRPQAAAVAAAAAAAAAEAEAAQSTSRQAQQRLRQAQGQGQDTSDSNGVGPGEAGTEAMAIENYIKRYPYQKVQ